MYTIWQKRCHFAVKVKLQPNAQELENQILPDDRPNQCPKHHQGFFQKGSVVKICLIKCTKLSNIFLMCPPSVQKIETLNVHIFLFLALYEKILGNFGTQDEVPQHAKWEAESPKHCQDMSLSDIFLASPGTSQTQTRWFKQGVRRY